MKSIKKRSKISFVSGVFNIVHSGHIRLLQFASELADKLVVAVYSDEESNSIIKQEKRLEGILALSCVDDAFILSEPLEDVIEKIRPDYVVKGKEFSDKYNIEEKILKNYKGKLLFASSEHMFSSKELISYEMQKIQNNLSQFFIKPTEYLERHNISQAKAYEVINKIQDLNIIVIGDLIIDEYISCDAIGLSQEDPTIVVSPFQNNRFIGGSAIVAAHAKALGAKVKYLSVFGDDDSSKYALEELHNMGVEVDYIYDLSRPTTLKQRYRASDKTLLRVNHLRKHFINEDIEQRLRSKFTDTVKNADIVLLSDFNYGVLSNSFIEFVTNVCIDNDIMIVADSQSSSQIGNVSRFKNMTFITPTEREARLAMQDQHSGLVILAESLRQKSKAKHIILTLGSEGLLIQSDSGAWVTDRISALNPSPVDVAGGGDSLFVMASLTYQISKDIWLSAYLGSIAASIQVSRIGNKPISKENLLKIL